MELSKTERIWNLLSMFVFVLLLIGTGTLIRNRGMTISDIGILELVLITIATYRMTRLIVYDRIFKLVRDIIRSFGGTGLGDSLKAIITCPWCAGVWISLFNVAIFYLVPFGDLFIYAMSIAGVATFLQLTANVVGLAADERQMDVREKRKKNGFKH